MSSDQRALAPSQRLRVAYLLTIVGGYLDAYTYFERGGVFANAQTGNIVKLGIAFANGAHDTYLFFLIPIASFALGLFASLGLEELFALRRHRLVRRSVLLVEMCGLALVGFIPEGEGWDMLANCIVAFVAAMQYETFTTFRGDPMATTMSTGNLRKFVDCLYAGTMHQDIPQLMRAARFLSIIVVFTLGAVIGTFACKVWDAGAIFPAVGLLACAVATITLLRSMNARDLGE